ncbi:MAG: hypothetical protein ABIA83_00930 [Patescibacteria group bacterium]
MKKLLQNVKNFGRATAQTVNEILGIISFVLLLPFICLMVAGWIVPSPVKRTRPANH